MNKFKLLYRLLTCKKALLISIHEHDTWLTGTERMRVYELLQMSDQLKTWANQEVVVMQAEDLISIK